MYDVLAYWVITFLCLIPHAPPSLALLHCMCSTMNYQLTKVPNIIKVLFTLSCNNTLGYMDAVNMSCLFCTIFVRAA